jgi:hypothetical protein
MYGIGFIFYSLQQLKFETQFFLGQASKLHCNTLAVLARNSDGAFEATTFQISEAAPDYIRKLCPRSSLPEQQRWIPQRMCKKFFRRTRIRQKRTFNPTTSLTMSSTASLKSQISWKQYSTGSLRHRQTVNSDGNKLPPIY